MTFFYQKLIVFIHPQVNSKDKQSLIYNEYNEYNEGEYEKDILSIYNSKDTPILSFFVHVWSKIGL